MVEAKQAIFLISGFAIALLGSCTSVPHYVGEGASTPKEAVERFLFGYLSSEYLKVRDLVYYDENCMGFMAVALDPLDANGVETYLADHHHLINNSEKFLSTLEEKKAIGDDLLVWAVFIEQGCLQKIAPHLYRYSYPTMILDDQGRVAGTHLSSRNEFTVIKKKQRWFILNPQCNAFSCFGSESDH